MRTVCLTAVHLDNQSRITIVEDEDFRFALFVLKVNLGIFYHREIICN